MSTGFIRSLLFNKNKGWTIRKAQKWAKSKGYRYKEVEESKNYIRFPQSRRRAKRFRYKEFGKGIEALFGYNNGRKRVKNPGQPISELVTLIKTDGEWQAYIPFLDIIMDGKNKQELTDNIIEKIEEQLGMQVVDTIVIKSGNNEEIMRFDIRDTLKEIEEENEDLEGQEAEEYWFKSKWED